MGDKLEVFTLHSKGEKNGVPFSPSSIPLSTLETIVSNVPAFVIGSGVQGAKKNDIRDAMSVSIADGSLSVGVALPAALATVLNALGYVCVCRWASERGEGRREVGGGTDSQDEPHARGGQINRFFFKGGGDS